MMRPVDEGYKRGYADGYERGIREAAEVCKAEVGEYRGRWHSWKSALLQVRRAILALLDNPQ